MKLKQIITKTRVPSYRSALWIVITNNLPKSFDQVEDEISVTIHSLEDVNSTRAYTFAYVEEDGRKVFMLFLKPTSTHGEIAHEIKHVVNLIFLWHDVRLNASNDESECYFLEVITDKVYGAIKKYKKMYSAKPVKKIENKVENT